MKWQAIAGVTNQINEEAKAYLYRKLEKDTSVEAPKLWSEFLTDTTKHMADSQTRLEVKSNDKTGGLSALMQFDALHPDFKHHNVSFPEYTLNKFDERSNAYLGSVKNPLTKKFLQQKIGEYRVAVAQNVTGTEARLVDGKRYSMAVDNIESFKNATFDNPQYFESNLNDVITGISSLALPLEAKEKLIHNARNDLAYSAALGSLKSSPESFLQQMRIGISQNKGWGSHLTFEQRVKLENQANRILQHQQAMQENQLKSLLPSHFESILKTGAGIPNLDNLFQATFGKDSDRYRQIKQTESAYHKAFVEMETIKNTDFANAAKRLEELRPKGGINEEASTDINSILESQHNYQQQMQIYSIMTKELQEQINHAKKDPAKYVEEYFNEELPDNAPFVQRLLLRKQIQVQKGLPDYLQRC